VQLKLSLDIHKGIANHTDKRSTGPKTIKGRFPRYPQQQVSLAAKGMA
jgi:hypothetical protein